MSPSADIPRYLEIACGFKDSSVMVFDPHMRNQHTILTFNTLRTPAKKEVGVKLLHWIPELTTRFLVQFEDNTFYEYDVLKDDRAIDEDEACQVVTMMRAIERVNFKNAFRESISSTEARNKFLNSLGGSSQKKVTFIETFSTSPPILNLGFLAALNLVEHGPLKIWRFNERCLIYDFKLAYINSSRLYFAMACGDNLTKIYDYFNYAFLCGFESYYGHPMVVEFSPDSTLLAVGYQDDSAAIYDLRNFTLLFRLEGHHSFVTHLKFDQTFSQLESVLESKKESPSSPSNITTIAAVASTSPTSSSQAVPISSQEEDKVVEEVLQLNRRSSTIKKTATKFYRLISGSEDGFLNFWDIHVARNQKLSPPSHDIANYDTHATVLNPVHRCPLDRVPIVHIEILDSIIAVVNETYNLRIFQPQYDVLKEQNECIDDDPYALLSKKSSSAMVGLDSIDFQLLEKQD